MVDVCCTLCCYCPECEQNNQLTVTLVEVCACHEHSISFSLLCFPYLIRNTVHFNSPSVIGVRSYEVNLLVTNKSKPMDWNVSLANPLSSAYKNISTQVMKTVCLPNDYS